MVIVARFMTLLVDETKRHEPSNLALFSLTINGAAQLTLTALAIKSCLEM